MKTATFVKELSGFAGAAKLYKLSEPVKYNKPYRKNDPPAEETIFVVVSATSVIFSGPETYIFPSDEDGKVVDWGELDGSFRGEFDHERALRGLGFEPVKGEAQV